jgi:GR25 family glycosyltransferase involved in LPS biosynthesis
MQIFVINLKKRIDRKNKMETILKKYNIFENCNFITAIDGEYELDNYNFSVIDNWFDPFKNRNIKKGEIATTLSHYAVWKKIVDENISMALILEDDIEFSDNIENMLDYLNEYMKKNSELDSCYLGRNPLNYTLNLGDEIIINDYLLKAKSSYNNHAYILTYNGAKKLINTPIINNILPVDEFFSIMFDNDYPFKQYSVHFESYPKLLVYALKNGIAFQNDDYSSAEESSFFFENDEGFAKESLKTATKTSAPLFSMPRSGSSAPPNVVQGCDRRSLTENPSNSAGNNNFQTFQLDLNASEEQKISYSKIINNLFIDFQNMSGNLFHFSINKTPQNKFSFLEKFIYDIAKQHCDNKNINIDDTVISFWVKTSPYNFEYIHTHFDHCDYEWRIMGSMKIKPIFTTLTYFDDNCCPTIITDITREMVDQRKFINNDNKQFILSFPKVMKHVCFDSGNYSHGESYIQDYDPEESRKTLVVAVWYKNNSPYHIPNYCHKLFQYYRFTLESTPIEYELFDISSTPIVLFNYNRTKTIKIQDNNLINLSFFNDLVIERKKKVLYQFKDFVKPYLLDKDYIDTFFFDFSEIFLNNNFNNKLNENFKSWKINHRIDKTVEVKLIKYINETVIDHSILGRSSVESFQRELSEENEVFSVGEPVGIEKIVENIANFYIKQLNLCHQNIFVSYELTSHKLHLTRDLNKSIPFLTTFSYFGLENVKPIILTNITDEEYKFKSFDETDNICCFYPTEWSTTFIDGGKYYSHNKALVVHLWKIMPLLELSEENGQGPKVPTTKSECSLRLPVGSAGEARYLEPPKVVLRDRRSQPYSPIGAAEENFGGNNLNNSLLELSLVDDNFKFVFQKINYKEDVIEISNKNDVIENIFYNYSLLELNNFIEDISKPLANLDSVTEQSLQPEGFTESFRTTSGTKGLVKFFFKNKNFNDNSSVYGAIRSRPQITFCSNDGVDEPFLGDPSINETEKPSVKSYNKIILNNSLHNTLKPLRFDFNKFS